MLEKGNEHGRSGAARTMARLSDDPSVLERLCKPGGLQHELAAVGTCCACCGTGSAQHAGVLLLDASMCVAAGVPV